MEIPQFGERWRKLIDGLEDLAKHPEAAPHDVEEARERLGNLIGRVKLMPDNGILTAQVGLKLIAFGDRSQRIEEWQGPGLYTGVVAGGGFVRSHSASLRPTP